MKTNDYDSSNGGGSITRIQNIIKEAKALEKEAIHSEEEAQKSYEDMVGTRTRPLTRPPRT